jgi:hypothetical protein
MRFRSVSCLFIAGFFLWVSAASAQKRVYAKIIPNTAFLNNNADIFDPATGKITPVSNPMQKAREQHVAVRLASGKILIAGGYDNHYLSDAEIFNPANGTFSLTQKVVDSTNVATTMVSARNSAAAVLMSSGDAFIIGGYNGTYLKNVDVYDPAKGSFSTLSAQMNKARQNPSVVMLNDGSVLVVGGLGSEFVSKIERYDPTDRLFVDEGDLFTAREGNTATLLSDGTVLIAGGCNNSLSSEIVCDNYLQSAELFDSATNVVTITGSMIGARKGHTAILLKNGKVLITGGTDGTNILNTAEIYDPQTRTFSSTGMMGTPRIEHTASLLPDGKVLIAGGQADTPLQSMEVYDPETGTFVTLDAVMSFKRAAHSATELSDGKILLVGGRNHNLMSFDVNMHHTEDNIAPNIYFTPDSQLGFFPYTGSGTVLVLKPQTELIPRLAETGGQPFLIAPEKLIETGGKPFNITPILNGQKLAVVSALDNKIFIINPNTLQAEAPYTFNDAQFGFGSILTVSPDGSTGYISSTATGEVIKFDVASGTELGRLSNLKAPAQITLTKSGKLLIVDTIAETVVIADAGSMKLTGAFQPLYHFPLASFSIANKVLLNADETIALIPSSAYASSEANASGALLFDPSTGDWILDEDDDDNDGSTTDVDEDEGDKGYYKVGYQPGFGLLLPDKSRWLLLTQDYLSLVPTIDPRNDAVDEVDDNTKDEASYTKNYPNAGGAPLTSANIVLSADAKYAFYSSASSDRIYQQDLSNGAVVGSFAVGDDPNSSVDQASSLAFTPDYKVLSVINFASNEIELLADSEIFRQTKFLSKQDQFTGLSLINLSDSSAVVTVTAMSNSGAEYDTDADSETTYDDLENPATVILEPHAQKSIDISDLIGFKNENDNAGYLVIESLQPILAGFTANGSIQSSYLSSYISNLQANPLYRGYGNFATDLILPEIPTVTGASTEISLVNPNYTDATYDLIHYGTDGTVIEKQSDNVLKSANRITQSLSDIVAQTNSGKALITGGVAGNKARSSSAYFLYESVGNSQVARYGHTATLLPNGNVLIAGGKNGFSVLKNAEIYMPASKEYNFSPGSMVNERYRHTATRLGNGLVLLAGGQGTDAINQSAELFNSVSGSFYPTGKMTRARDAHTATRLNNGKVLLTGGLDGIGITATAELYDPATGKFEVTKDNANSQTVMNSARAFHTATLLQDGTVLITGGYNGGYLNTAELYDPQSGKFIPVEPMNSARSNHAAVMLSNGTVLITGGVDADTVLTGGLDSAEIYDFKTKLFAKTRNNMTAHRSMHAAINLYDDTTGSNDKIAIIGGYGFETVICNESNSKATDTDCDADGIEDSEEEEPTALAIGDIFDQESGLFSKATVTLLDSRQEFTAVLLQEGVAAGYTRLNSDAGLIGTEFYNAVKGGAVTSANGINVNAHIGVKSIFSPRFVITAAGRNTQINIINANSDKDATVTILLHAASDGTILSTVEKYLTKNAQIKGDLRDIMPNASAFQGQEGWIEVVSSEDRIVGTVSFTNSTNKYLASFELSASPMNHFVYPLISEDSQFETEISLMTPEVAAQVELELWDPSGQKDGSTAIINLAAKSSFSKTLRQIFPGMSDHNYGYVTVRSTSPIYASGEMRYKNLRLISSVPPVLYPE